MATAIACSGVNRHELLPTAAKLRVAIQRQRSKVEGGDGASAAPHESTDRSVARRLYAIVKATRIVASRKRLEDGTRDEGER